MKRREWIGTTNVNVPGATSITVASMKGGVGKTTVSSLLGLTLAQHRGDRVVALDANPDAGTLADRLLGVDVEGRRPTIRDLLNKRDAIEAGTQLNRFLGLAGRLAVLASEMDPAKSEMFNQSEYEAVACLIARFYDVLITDSGTGLVHSAMHGALNLTDGLVIVGAPTVDAANSAGRTLDWLTEHGFSELVSNAVVAISCDRGSPDVDRGRIHDHFASRCRAVVEIPADPHLSTGGQINLNALQQPTLDKALELSAHVAEGFHHHASSTLMKKAGLANGPPAGGFSDRLRSRCRGRPRPPPHSRAVRRCVLVPDHGEPRSGRAHRRHLPAGRRDARRARRHRSWRARLRPLRVL
ncbi:MinD/ParA family protein [Pseudonocardia sp. ICBG601]|uniref:MinD/ParA family ATP-binding protein n=1 Tax=Pseudonocardia sp. ICBG601 TaxID=2846759 RepID=UPI001CF68DF1|nr:MinD/ParA family protein [Pseudonocardia sp. ICBG601]